MTTCQQIEIKKRSILQSFYFHEVFQHLRTFIYKSFWYQRVLRFAIEDAWISSCVTRHLDGGRELGSYVVLKCYWHQFLRDFHSSECFGHVVFWKKRRCLASKRSYGNRQMQLSITYFSWIFSKGGKEKRKKRGEKKEEKRKKQWLHS